MCGIDYINQKITNHTGRKTLVQELQKSGFSRDSMKLATRHKNVESLDSYELPREQEQIGMINNLVDNIQCTKRKQDEKNKGFVTAKEAFASNCEISNTNNLKDLHKSLQEINPNNTNQFNK
ncbi:unnamed protein product [Rhizophagus irregularis]|nr:unnamed protein product [Rhizophagus irregularis]CAB5099782.1 unnamed protein product [Rhizophagus irregularis]